MGTIANALTWSGSSATLSMFVVSSHEAFVDFTGILMEAEAPQIKVYPLDDEDNVLQGGRVVEYDLLFSKLPTHLNSLLTQCLDAARASGAKVAWFGFEGSFDFDCLLTAEIANQIYAVMDSEGTALTSDAALSSAPWQERIVRAGEHARSTSDSLLAE